MIRSAVGTPVSASVTVDGITVNYTDTAGPASSTRLPLVLVHGSGGSAATHFSFVGPMASTRTRVIAIDLADTAEAELSLDALARQVEGVLDQVLAGQRVSLLGYSLGAVVSELVASRRSDVVQNLVLVAGWMKTDEQQRLRNDVWHELADNSPIALGKFSTFCAFGSTFLGARTADELAALHQTAAPSDFLKRQMDLNRRIDIVSEVEQIQAATLIVGLSEDVMVPMRHSREMFGAIVNARFASLQSGHAVVFERPAQLFSLVDIFTEDPEQFPAGSTMLPPQP
ncbi:MAG: alpha/beta fold hydrolase [Microbacteriaceae bacterium]